jgi:pSer/pThr/pTyr-binding forkhead associated (FHA) protein
VIICSRCGKENQKHYKFCLGCGAKLEALAPAVAAEPAKPASSNEAAALGVAKTAPPPADALSFAATGMTGAAATGPAAEAPVATTSSRPQLNAGTPAQAVPAGLASPEEGVPEPGVPARDMIPCPKCGKTVMASYAFCGSCGNRMKPPATGAPSSAAAAVPKTMFMTPASAPGKTAPRGHLTLIRPDGTEGGVHPLHEGENLIGRGQGALFDADPYLSPRHAECVFSEEGLVVRDLRSLNGVFIKIMQEERLESGDIFRIGQELLRFDVISPPAPLEDGTEIIGTPNPGYWGRVSVIVGRDVDGPAFPLYDESVVLGRERGDILFPEDGYVSGTHAQITLRDGRVYLSDLGSSNGSFFRIRGSRLVPSGSLLLMGQQLFRASYR